MRAFWPSLSVRVTPHRDKKTRLLSHRRQPWARGSPSPRATATGAPPTCRGRWTSCLRETSPRPAAAARRDRLLLQLVLKRCWCWKVRRSSSRLHSPCLLAVRFMLATLMLDCCLVTPHCLCVTWIPNNPSGHRLVSNRGAYSKSCSCPFSSAIVMLQVHALFKIVEDACSVRQKTKHFGTYYHMAC